MLRFLTRLFALTVALALVVGACGDDGDDEAADVVDDADVTTSTTTATTGATGGTDTTDTTAGDPAGGTQPATVAVTVDGERVGLREACRGADGAVVAIATTGRRIILVREEGLAIRLGTEGNTFAETSEVDVETVGVTTIYSGTVDVEGQPTDVVIEVAEDADLEPCAS